jgi:hypothetical protein
VQFEDAPADRFAVALILRVCLAGHRHLPQIVPGGAVVGV